MKTNICETLLRRSVENQFLTYIHNRREDEKLEDKFSLYQRQIRVIDHSIHMAEHRFERHARKDLGLIISYTRKQLVPSDNHQFYYTSTNKNWTTKEYSVEPFRDIVQDKNCYEFAFERRSHQYLEKLKQQTHLHKLRKQQFMNKTESLIRDDYERTNDWPRSDYARSKLPLIHHSKSNRLPKIHFPIEI